MNNALDDTKTQDVTAQTGRDYGKTFRVKEVGPMAMAGFILRLLHALRLGHQEDLLSFLQPGAEDVDISAVMRLLAGCDPEAVQALLHDMLDHVQVAADPQHPKAFRALNDNDIREMATLGDIIGAFVRVNVLSG